MTVLSSRFFIEDDVKNENGLVKCNFNAKNATKFNLVVRGVMVDFMVDWQHQH